MKLLEKKGSSKVKLNILKDVWGKADAGKTTAIMGASGAGKTSLFQVLTGRTPTQGDIVVEGDIYLNGCKIDPKNREHRKLFAYVAQEDALHETSTVKESLLFSAKLRLSRSTSQEEINRLVDKIIHQLGLESAADTMIGGQFQKGISGGQKRRVSIGIELIASPSIIFLDEPTSGLDSFAAAQVMKLLNDVAAAGNTVLFTIHQPSSKIFSTFDDLILLNHARVMHIGAVQQIAHDFSTFYDQPVPESYNPADWVIDVSQLNNDETLTKMGFFKTERDSSYGTAHSSHEKQPHNKLVIPETKTVSAWQEFRLLQQRELRNLLRAPVSVVLNVCITGFLSLIFAVIFWGIGRKDRAYRAVVGGQVGAVVNLLISTLFGQANPALMVFIKDRPIFLREYSTDHYTIVPYFLSKLWSEALASFISILTQTLVTYWSMGFQMGFWELFVVCYALALTSTAVATMLGASFTDGDNAMQIFPLIVVPQLFFSGLFISIDLIPSWVRWLQYLCSMMYASRLSFAYEFDQCGAEESEAAQNCQEILDLNNVEPSQTYLYWIALLGIFVLFRGMGILLLRSNGSY